jgi:hypothetical protein
MWRGEKGREEKEKPKQELQRHVTLNVTLVTTSHYPRTKRFLNINGAKNIYSKLNDNIFMYNSTTAILVSNSPSHNLLDLDS